jgi:DNA-binding transcriptional LysR family regulator
MELRHLRYFVAVAEELNFTRAAARLRVAQPALSSQIHDLENELETPLFERRRTGVLLTRAGKTFFPRARAILAEAAAAANDARTAGGRISGSLVLGYPSGLHLNYLQPVIGAFRKAHPKVEFDFVHAAQTEQLKALREGRIDAAFVNLPAPLEGLAHQTIWRIPYKVVLPRLHPLAKQRTFTLAQLRNEDFVFCTRESRPDFYDEFFRQCANAGFRPRVVKEVGGYPTNMLGLISIGVGLSVLPHFQQVERFRGLVWRPLAAPKLWVDMALVWRRQPASPVIEQFAALADDNFQVSPEAEPF